MSENIPYQSKQLTNTLGSQIMKNKMLNVISIGQFFVDKKLQIFEDPLYFKNFVVLNINK